MLKSRKVINILIILLSLVFLISNVSGYSNHINITMKETVYSNVTFAKDFYLTEENPYCKIDGVLNITNTGAETVSDIYITFTNIDRMVADFVKVDGKNGTIYYGGAGILLNVSDDIGNSANQVQIQDLNNDKLTDYVYVNRTHFIFNISGQLNRIGIAFYNATQAGLDINNAGVVNIPIKMNDVSITNGSYAFGNVSLDGLVITNNYLNVSTVSIDIKERIISPIILHIPELRSGNYTVFNYSVGCNSANSPVDIETNYSNSFHNSINRKVLAGYNWTIIQNVSNNFYLPKNVTNVNITMTAQGVQWNSSVFNFSLESINSVGDYTNVTGPGISNLTWWWAPAGGQLNWGDSRGITFDMIAPASVPYTATYLALIEEITYDAPFLMSNLSIVDINASSYINFTFQKRIYKPADNEFSNNVTWLISPAVSVPPSSDIEFNLNRVTMWVTRNQNPNNDTTATMWGQLEKIYNVGERINNTRGWGNDSNLWYFNYTDGSSASAPPPIIWMRPEWLITNDYGQITNFTQTVNGRDLYLKYIYVVNGYWLQITKNITNIGEDQYQIYSYVENIGNGWTPQYEYVTVYDFVPGEFAAYEFSDVTYLSMAVGQSGSEYQGMSYRWNIPFKGEMNSSLGPKNNPQMPISPSNYSWNVTYKVNGTGTYKVSELYIVGLDPLKVDGASGSPMIAVISQLQSHTKEIFYVSIVAFLIVINIANFVMTKRINNKLDK